MKNNKTITRLLTVLLIFGSLFGCSIHQPIQKNVLVVAHRGDWRNFPENSLEAIQSCIDMGVDIVEVDVAQTSDGHIVLMHDRTIDRTTNGTGQVSDFTLAELQKLFLRNGTGRVTTNFRVPTLHDAMMLADDKIMVNIDKADDFLADVYQVLEQTNTTNQAIIKSSRSYVELLAEVGSILDKMIFMPKIRLSDTLKYCDIEDILAKEYPMYEISFARENKPLMQRIVERLSGTESRIWINTLWESQNAGHCDDYAVIEPAANWGYLIDSCGATVLQTDRPALMLEYLRR